MKALSMLVIPLALMLTGCPGEGDPLVYGNWKWIYVDRGRVCFSIDKKEVVSSYYIESNEGNKNMIILGSDRRDVVSLSYPDTCFNIKLKTGYQYGALYVLDGIKYRYEFFIDNNWNVVSLKGAN